jgi:hypothetical protein
VQIFEQGWMAGVRGDDPRTCPYAKMTVEAREWQTWHRIGAFYATAFKPCDGCDGHECIDACQYPNASLTNTI